MLKGARQLTGRTLGSSFCQRPPAQGSANKIGLGQDLGALYIGSFLVLRRTNAHVLLNAHPSKGAVRNQGAFVVPHL